MALRDHARDEVNSDDTSLRVGREEDGVGTAEIIDPCGVGQVSFEQSAVVSIRRACRIS